MSSRAARCLTRRCPPDNTNLAAATLLPFLYQTPTICRRTFHSPNPRSQDGQHVWIPANVREAREARDAEKANQAAPIPDDDTITPTERRAFQRMFENFTKTARARHKTSKTFDSDEPTEDPEFALLERESWQSIFAESSDATIAEEVADLMSSDMEERASNIQKLPPGLRNMAHRAHYQMSQEMQRQEVEKRVAQKVAKNRATEEADQTLRASRDRMRQIGIELIRAKTDAEIWGILDNKVFSLMRRLHEDQERIRLEKQSKKRSKKSRKKQKQDTMEQSTPETKVVEGDVKQQHLPMTRKEMSTVAYMYHPLLLLAARLLCSRTKYTPLAIALLPAIKSLGYSSYALGASTGLYNCLMEYYWRVYADVGTISSLLQEMASAGLLMDANTDNVLAQIVAHSQEAEAGLLGAPLQALEGMDGRASEIEHIKQWRQAIRRSMEEDSNAQERRRKFEEDLRKEEALEEEENASRAEASSNLSSKPDHGERNQRQAAAAGMA